jgi:hypothetical protein
MLEFGPSREHPELRKLVAEASRALACLDAARLEELALSCDLLVRDLRPANAERRANFARQSREAEGDMAVFARVLEATRANLDVLERLRELRAGRFEYGDQHTQGCKWMERGHGDH